jgi:hypothetical protein
MTTLDPTFERRLAAFLARRPGAAADDGSADRRTGPSPAPPSGSLADALADQLGGEIVGGADGCYVRVDAPVRDIPIDRERLARLPGQPPADVPLVCLDTETTGLGTAAGTVAFLIGLGWWIDAVRFRQVQLVLPDHGHETALLAALSDLLPERAWLVTYNGRGFDWPLLVTRYRMHATSPPAHAGHLDLLPIVRRVFRHRLADARLRTVEAALLGMLRPGDVEGWQIPGRYLLFLQSGDASGLAEIVRHNDQDVRSLARIVQVLERRYADSEVRASAPAGDLAGLARAFSREQRLEEALECIEAALAAPAPGQRDPFGRTRPTVAMADPEGPDPDERGAPWWAPSRRPDVGGSRPRPPMGLGPTPLIAPWTSERIALERARLLRRLARVDDAIGAWQALGTGSGHLAAAAWIEVAKLEEHRRHDPVAALDAVERAARIVERSRFLGRPWPALETDLTRRRRRLRRRLAPTGPRRSLAAPLRSGSAA